MNYQRCTRCVMDNSIDTTIKFDENGLCNYCTDALEQAEYTYFPNDIGERKLNSLIENLKSKGRGKSYDCMMGISGGLDSAYLAYLGCKWGLRILALHIDDGYDTPIAKNNLDKLTKACGINMIVVKPDEEQYNDITKAFMLADLPGVAVPQDNILFAELYHYARKYHINTFLSGGNFALESILQHNENPVSVFDMQLIHDVHKRFGSKSMINLRYMSNFQRLFDRFIYRIHTVRPLNLINYNRNQAINELKEFCGFEYYEQKHCENILTKIIQLYWLPKKFGLDKRTSHLSSMIISGQISRDDALKELNKPQYDSVQMEKDIAFFLQKIGMSREEFDKLVERPGKSYSDYHTSHFYRFLKKDFNNLWLRIKADSKGE